MKQDLKRSCFYGELLNLFKKIKKYRLYFALIFIGVFVSCLYYPVLNAQYVWDDTLLIVTKTGLRENPLSWELISSPVLPGTSYFRPLIFLSWYWEFKFFGQNPYISHLIGIIVFAVNSSLVFIFGLLLSKRFYIKNGFFLSLIATILYICHPSLIESTVWVSGRFDQYCTLFSLLTLFLFVRGFVSSKQSISIIYVLGISFCYLSALLSKELGIVLPIMIIIFYVCLERDLNYLELLKDAFKYQKTLIIFLLITTLIYFVLRISAMSQVYHVKLDENYYYNFVWLQILPLYAIKYYIIQIFFPFSNIDILAPLNEIDNSILGKLSASLASLFVLALVVWSLIKRNLSSALFLCAFVGLFLVLYFIPLGLSSNLGHSRFLTLPLAFISLSLIFFPYQEVFKKILIKNSFKKLISVLVCTTWIGLSILTVRSVIPFWMNEYTLWSWAYKNHSQSALARYNYLYAATVYHKFDEVIQVAEKYKKENGGLEVPDQAVYANALLNMGDVESLNYYEGVISVLPKFHEINTKEQRAKVNNFNMTAAQLGDVYSSYAIGVLLMRNDIPLAMKNLEISEWYRNSDEKANVYYYLSIVLFLSNKEKAALEIFQQQKKRDLKIGVNNYRIVPDLIEKYCIKYDAVNTQCSEFLKNNPFH